MLNLLSFITLGKIFFLSWSCYPILCALLVPIATIGYEHLFKYKHSYFKKLPNNEQPSISIFVPAHNEQKLLAQTIIYLATKLYYSNYEIIIIDDGSTDKTPMIADNLENKYKRVRVIHVLKNAGKAHGYNVALGFANGDLIYSNDADTIPEPDCLWKFANYFVGKKQQNVGGVTGNMDVLVRNKSLEKSQVVEFTSIIGGIKRSQEAYSGHEYGFSGATLMVRKDALIDAGGFSQSIATEDIDLTVRLIRNGWEALFAPNIFAYMKVPNTIRGLFNERKRWAEGGTSTWLCSFRLMLEHPYLMRQRMLIQFDATLSNVWSFLYFIFLIIFIYKIIYYCIQNNWNSLYYLIASALLLACFEFTFGAFQILVALHYDDNGYKKRYFLFAWMYIIFTWLINPITVVWTFIPAVKTAVAVMRGKVTKSNSWNRTR